MNTSAGFKTCAATVRQRMQEWQVGERAAYVADLAVDEILNNILQHAYTDDQPRAIGITLRRDHDQVSLRFSDDGAPFDPLAAAPLQQSSQIDTARIGGRGLLMLHRMADRLQYERQDQRNHLTVTIKTGP